MKNFSIFGIHRKMWFFREVYKKPIYRGDCLKRGASAVGRFKGGLARKRRVVFKSKLKSDTSVKSNKHNSMVMFTFSVFDWSYLFWQIWSQNSKPETSFLGIFGPKNKNHQFKLKFGS